MTSNVTSVGDGHQDRGLLFSKLFNASVTSSSLCPNITRHCGASGTIPHRQTQGFMATVVMVFLLCLVIAYCCWGACCKLLKKRRACTDDDDETTGYSSEASYPPSTVTSASLQNESRVPRCAYRTRIRGPKPARGPQIPPPSYESIFGADGAVAPPSYSMLDLSPSAADHASDCEDATLLAGHSQQRSRITGAESTGTTDGSFPVPPKRFSSSASIEQLAHLQDALPRAN